MEKAWHQHSESETLLAHKTNIEKGLSNAEVAALSAKHGDNKLHNFKRKSAFRILLSQFTDLLVIILILAAIISAFLGEPEDTIAIIAIVVLNALLGFIQEYRAEKSMEALKALSTPVAKVKRMGQFIEIPTYQIVPGDIVAIEAGQFIPADLRILKSTQLGVDESSLTGESNTINKISEAIPHESLPIADQKNMAFKGTMVTSGNAIGIVVSTGMNTELGKIAKLLKEEVEVNTPLQNKMARFAKMLTIDAYSCGLTLTGQIKCWGENIKGQLGMGDFLSKTLPTSINSVSTYKDFSVGGFMVCAQRSDNLLQCWGRVLETYFMKDFQNIF